MFRLAHPDHLFALLAIPLLAVLFVLMQRRRKNQWSKLGEFNLINQLRKDSSNRKPWVRFSLFLFALSMVIIAWANPQIGSKLEEVKRQGVDLVVALDVSNSMRAQDLKPDRLERAKQVISRLIDKMENDRICLIVFAGEAYVQLPITTDYAAAKLFLNNIETNMVPTQGTAIGAAIRLSMKSFTSNDNKHKAVIIITDGENHEDDAVEAAKEAAEAGVVIHTVGMGSIEGTPIPVARNSNGGLEFLTDKEGQTVLTKLDETTLQRIATEAHGQYIHSVPGNDGLEEILTQIGKMEKKTFDSKQYTDYEDRFQYFIALALIALIADQLIGNRKSNWVKKLKLSASDEA